MTTDPAVLLLRAAAACRAAAVDEDDALNDVADFLAAGARGPLDVWIDAAPGWRRSTRDRDQLIRETAKQLLGSMPVERQAATLNAGLGDYRNNSFHLQSNPHAPGSLSYLYHVMLVHRDHLLSRRQFEKIISVAPK